MDKNVIRLSKSVKIIGTTGIVIFIIIFALYFTENFLASLLCIPVILLGAVLLLAYKEETIILKDDELVFNYLVKKTQHIKYDRIHCLLIIPLNRRTEIALIDKEYNRLISLNILLANIDYLFEKLEEKNIQILDLGDEANVRNYVNQKS